MANNCWYQMRIAGKKESVDQFIAMLSGKAPTRLGRVFSVYTDEPFTPYPGNKGIGYADISGDCAWSIKESMLPGQQPLRHPCNGGQASRPCCGGLLIRTRQSISGARSHQQG